MHAKIVRRDREHHRPVAGDSADAEAIALRLQSITKFQTSFGDPAYLGIPHSYQDELAKLVHPAVAAAVIADA